MNTNNSQKHTPATPATPGANLVSCPLWRRLLVILYDSIAALAIMFLVSAIWVSLNSGQAISVDTNVYPLYLLTLWLAIWLYLAISWRRAGQTLGMRAWRVHLLNSEGNKISWATSFLRYSFAWIGALAFGLGYVISLFRKDRACLHDLVSSTSLILKLPGAADKPRN